MIKCDQRSDIENEASGGDFIEGKQRDNFRVRDDCSMMQSWQLPVQNNCVKLQILLNVL